MLHGKIIKGIAGFYYVISDKNKIYECKAKGIFRKDKMKPLVGDNVEIDVISENDKTGNIVRILPRFNALIRPAVANVDMALVIFAIKKPKPNFNLLDRFLVMMEKQGVETVICFNKADLSDEQELSVIKEWYGKSGYKVIFFSAKEKSGIDEIKTILKNKTTTVAGPSGVGKSTFINSLLPKDEMQTGEISDKIDRGKHTTRHSQLIAIDDNTFIMDTPGFSSLFIDEMAFDELKNYYPEFVKYEDDCRFAGCMHLKEPDCAVKRALSDKLISEIRYENYEILVDELKNRKRVTRNEKG